MDWYIDAIKEIITMMIIIPMYIIRLVFFIILFPFIYSDNIKKILLDLTSLIDNTTSL